MTKSEFLRNRNWKVFQDRKNLLNLRTFQKLQKAINSNDKICFSRVVNDNKYNYMVSRRNNRLGVVIRNITQWSALALIIDGDCFNVEYNDFINKVGTT